MSREERTFVIICDDCGNEIPKGDHVYHCEGCGNEICEECIEDYDGIEICVECLRDCLEEEEGED